MTTQWPQVMVNPVREYDWGSTRALARLQGRRPTGRREAELWMGAHPVAPSRLRQPDGSEVSLSAAIEADPAGVMGAECADQFGTRLPFLLKVLAVDRALSIQVHPTPAQAAAGFAREQAAGVPVPWRSYADPYAKPEMLVAVTEFAALAGLRDSEHARRLIGRLDMPAMRPVMRGLESSALGLPGTAGALGVLATWPEDDRAALAAAVAGRVRDMLARRSGELNPADRADLEWVLALAAQHSADPMVVVPLLLQAQRLHPGEAMFVPAGVPHTYLSGVGVEIMASSDNVVRAGLTTKPVDAEALVTLLDPRAKVTLPVPQVRVGAGECRWQLPVEEFALSHMIVDGSPLVLAGDPSWPRVLLCLRGDIKVAASGHQVRLTGGHSAFLGASAFPGVVDGRGEVYCATVGLAVQGHGKPTGLGTAAPRLPRWARIKRRLR